MCNEIKQDGAVYKKNKSHHFFFLNIDFNLKTIVRIRITSSDFWRLHAGAPAFDLSHHTSLAQTSGLREKQILINFSFIKTFLYIAIFQSRRSLKLKMYSYFSILFIFNYTKGKKKGLSVCKRKTFLTYYYMYVYIFNCCGYLRNSLCVKTKNNTLNNPGNKSIIANGMSYI